MPRLLKTLGAIGAGLLLASAGALGFGLLFIITAFFIGCVAFAFFHYRYLRQEELLYLLTTAAESGAPLGPAVWAYVDDRPRSRMREIWVSLLMLVGYYWFWHRKHCYDRKVEKTARLLEGGLPLHQALLAVPGVASKETILAAAVGESTGKLALCLQNVPRWRMVTAWLEAAPRFIYPLFLLLFVNSILFFWLLHIAPKMEKIFHDFKIPLPEVTRRVIDCYRVVLKDRWNWAFVVGVALLVPMLLLSSTVCWYFPPFGRIYRRQVRSRFLKMLGLLLQTGKTVPAGLKVLEESGYFAGLPRQRLLGLREKVEDGEPFLEAAYRQGLVSRASLPLLQAAERAQNLPWALMEIGELLARQAVQSLQRLTMALFPIAVLAAGILVGFVAAAFFFPLVQMITELPS